MAKISSTLVAAIAAAFMLVSIVNLYIFDRMTGLLGFHSAAVSLTCAFGLAALLAAGFALRTSSGRGTAALFVAVTTAYGLEFMALPGLLAFEIINLLSPLPELLCGQAIVVFVCAIALISLVNAQRLRVRSIRLPFPMKLRAVQISDAHIGAVHGPRYLSRIVEIVNGLNPDIVLITGDIISGAVAPDQSRLGGFSCIAAKTFMAPGNHEYYEGMDEMRAALPNSIRMLRDEEADMGEYSIFGLDFVQEQGMSGTRNLERKFSKPVIVMAHVPQFMDLPKGSVILSGHYHAGQIFPFNFLAPAFIKLFRGIYRKNGVTLYVSPGTATWGPPMRFGSRNEITLLELGPD